MGDGAAQEKRQKRWRQKGLQVGGVEGVKANTEGTHQCAHSVQGTRLCVDRGEWECMRDEVDRVECQGRARSGDLREEDRLRSQWNGHRCGGRVVVGMVAKGAGCGYHAL